jgi:chromosome segregation ATPase
MKGAGKKTSAGSDGSGKDVLEHLRSMQQMERDTQSTLEKFMSALSQHAQTDYAGLLEEKIRELQAATEEIRRLGNEVLRNEERINELVSKEERAAISQAHYIEEQMKHAKALSQSDQVIKKLQSQLVLQQQKHQQDLEVKVATVRALEEESLRSKVQADEANARMESMALEATELHSAMASLHGEIAAQQRELDEFQEREQRSNRQKKEMAIRIEEKDVEIGRYKVEKRGMETKMAEIEKRLSDAALQGNQLQFEANSQVEQLVRERENVQGSLAKMSYKLKQQTGTQKELNALLSRMRLELAAAQDAVTMEKSRAENAERDIKALQIVVSSLEKAKIESDILIHRAEQEKVGLQSDLQQMSDNHTQLLSELRKSTLSLERLERERTELTIDLSGRVKDIESLRKIVESLQVEQEDLRSKLDHERMSKERALENNGSLDGELDRAKSDLRELQENVESLSRQLRESERMREQALEVSRAQQRENANRIIEFSQKNSKLASELSAKDDEVNMLRRNREEVLVQGQDSIRERDDFKQQYYSARSRIQSLEDQNEETLARSEACKSEIEELRTALRREVASREQVVSSLNQKHEEIVANLTVRLEAEAEEKVSSALSSRKQTEDRMERAMVKERENHQQQQLEIQAQRQQDADAHRSRLATLAKAMEGLQVELREEVNKNTVLSQELAVLKELAEVGSGEMQERLNYLERERQRDRNRLEGQLADVKEQLRQQVEQKQQRDQLMSTIEQQLSREREARFTALQRVRAAEDEASNLTSQVDTLTEECSNAKKQVRDHERKLALALQAKDAELARLTRRNEVLGEAVTRLTAAQQQGSVGVDAAANPISRFFSRPAAFAQPAVVGSDFGADSPLDMDLLSTPGGFSSVGSLASVTSRAKSAPGTRRLMGLGYGVGIVGDSDNIDESEGADRDEHALDLRVSSAPLGATRKSMELPSAAVNNQAWQFNEEEAMHGSIASASPKNPDLEKIIAAQSQNGIEASPSPNRHSPITSPVTASPSSIATSSAATMADGLQNTANSIFKAKLEESVKKGKGTELPYSPKKTNAAPKVLASDVPAKRAVSKPISARKPPVF